jgi:hypothetical protein
MEQKYIARISDNFRKNKCCNGGKEKVQDQVGTRNHVVFQFDKPSHSLTIFHALLFGDGPLKRFGDDFCHANSILTDDAPPTLLVHFDQFPVDEFQCKYLMYQTPKK